MVRKHKGILLVISGFAGTGKGSVVSELMNQYDNYALSVSATTRKPRVGEVDGVHYFFKTFEEFQNMISEDQFVEYAQYVGNFYGTPKAYVQEQLEKGRDVILEIEMQGALKVKEKYPDTLLIFLVPPDADTLKRRLEERGTETPEMVEMRLARAVEETRYMDSYDYLIVNDDLETCIRQTHEIIQNEHYRVSRSREFADFLKDDLKKFKK